MTPALRITRILAHPHVTTFIVETDTFRSPAAVSQWPEGHASMADFHGRPAHHDTLAGALVALSDMAISATRP